MRRKVPGSADPAPSEGAATELSDTGDGAYHTAWESYSAADEECLGCHGGTREAVADLTADLGEWNPHRSIHGGYNSCHNCHAADKEITDNYCTHAIGAMLFTATDSDSRVQESSACQGEA